MAGLVRPIDGTRKKERKKRRNIVNLCTPLVKLFAEVRDTSRAWKIGGSCLITRRSEKTIQEDRNSARKYHERCNCVLRLSENYGRYTGSVTSWTELLSWIVRSTEHPRLTAGIISLGRETNMAARSVTRTPEGRGQRLTGWKNARKIFGHRKEQNGGHTIHRSAITLFCYCHVSRVLPCFFSRMNFLVETTVQKTAV